jgi:peptidylprolyl isomerase
MRVVGILAALALSACASAPEPVPPADGAGPADPAAPVRSVQEILDQSPATDWRPLDPENTIYMELERGRVIIELAPHYAPNHATNIRALARANYFDNANILRSQDNYVVQWGRRDEDPKPLGAATESVRGEVDRARAGIEFTALPDPDTYAPEVGFSNGFQVARNDDVTWMTHCYGVVGSARGDGLDGGNGGQLYVVLGQSPRNLDRNITLVGRVVQGMELLSTQPRGTGNLGFYETPGEMAVIRSIRVASDVPAAERANLQVLRTDSATWATVVDARRTRRESFFANNPVNRLGVCNGSTPVRTVPAN